MAGADTRLTIGICAFNEAGNIHSLLGQLRSCHDPRICEILVVSSGSTDGTDEAVRKAIKKDGRVRLISEKARKGKASAVNRIIESAGGDIIILCGADLRPEEGSIGRLADAFRDRKVGMAGARPIPLNDRRAPMGYCSHLMWGMHHIIALKRPKCGELVAVRAPAYRIPGAFGADEAYLEARFMADGWKIAYCPGAVVWNKGPESIGDFISQRRRIHAQHLFLRKATGYRAPTGDLPLVAIAFLSYLAQSPWYAPYAVFAAALEAVSTALGSYDYLRNRPHRVWAVAKTTKVLPA